jgi:hypothetical protein
MSAASGGEGGAGDDDAELRPFLDLRDEEVFLGEEILVVTGVRTAELVDASVLFDEPGELHITEPSGAVIVRRHEPACYDGPARVASLFHRESLDDLVPTITVGAYDLRYLVAGHEARRTILVRPSPAIPPVLELELPDPIDLEPLRPFVVSLALVNAGEAPLRLVPPDLCYGARVLGYVTSDDPPLWSRLDRIRPPVEVRSPFERVAPEEVDESALVTLCPGERHVSAVGFDGVLQPGLATQRGPTGTGPGRWYPRERFAVNLALVVHARVMGAPRPLRWLKRARAEYRVDGSLQGIGAPPSGQGDSEQVTPSTWRGSW